MRGIVTTPLNERTFRPSVNAPSQTSYDAGEKVDVVEAVLGDYYDGDNLWYRLSNNSFVWAGAVEMDFSGLPIREQDCNQYLISFRERKNGRPDLDSRKPPDQLYFAHVKFPIASDDVIVNDLLPDAFAPALAQAVKNDPREHVIIYIHGYQLLSSLKLDLFQHFVRNYSVQDNSNIAKVIFMTWPAFGFSRKEMDDGAIDMGRHFLSKDLIATFRRLGEELRKLNAGKTLNLFVHSFGHQLLNGIINPLPDTPTVVTPLPQNAMGIFDNIFLMAPDITLMAAVKNGFDLPNVYRKDDSRKKIKYALQNLSAMGQRVHVFHDQYDYLLYVSTRKSLDKKNRRRDNPGDEINPEHFRVLGNYGNTFIPQGHVALNDFNFVDVDKLVREYQGDVNLLYYPFRDLGDKARKIVEDTRESQDYKKTNGLRLIWNMKRFPDHHRYLFTCKPVVERVIRILNGGT
jgi:hypothetical protein